MVSVFGRLPYPQKVKFFNEWKSSISNCTCNSDGSLCESVPIIALVTKLPRLLSGHTSMKQEIACYQRKKFLEIKASNYFFMNFPKGRFNTCACVVWASDKLFIATKYRIWKTLNFFPLTFYQRKENENEETQQNNYKEGSFLRLG